VDEPERRDQQVTAAQPPDRVLPKRAHAMSPAHARSSSRYPTAGIKLLARAPIG
jgi:hypothetical protein